MSLKNYIFSSINTKGEQDSDKFATIRLKSLKKNMANAADENTTPNRAEVSVTNQNVTKTPESNGTAPKSEPEEFSCSWFFLGKGFLKIWSNITIEPLMLCWLLPSCFLFIAVENLALEKVCFFWGGNSIVNDEFFVFFPFSFFSKYSIFFSQHFRFFFFKIFTFSSSVLPCKFQL